MELKQVLFQHRELDVFRIPPRVGAGGWRSGEWRMNDKIFTGRVRVVATGEALEVRLEDPQTGELFGMAPVPRGQAHIAVEQAADSSRNFVLRLVDATSGRHAFVGISFADRATAFDFNVAISDHERQQKRAEEMEQIKGAADPLAAAANLMPEAAALYRQAGDLSLKEGETIKINMKKREHAASDGDSFLGRIGHAPQASGSGGGTAGKLMPLAPPPGQPAAPLGRLAPPPVGQPAAAAPSSSAQQSAAVSAADDLLGWGLGGSSSSSAAVPGAGSVAAVAANNPAPGKEDGWATFD